MYHLVRLETDQAAEWFEKAIEQREFGATVLLHVVAEKFPLAQAGEDDESPGDGWVISRRSLPRFARLRPCRLRTWFHFHTRLSRRPG